MSKTLPMAEPPIISAPHYAELLSMFLPFKDGYNWYVSNFTQLFVDYRVNPLGSIEFRDDLFGFWRLEKTFYYDYIPFIKCYNCIEDYRVWTSTEKLVDQFKFLLDHNYYINLFLDRYYITPASTEDHFLHPALLFGYENDDFLVADFIDHHRFGFGKISFTSMLKSYLFEQARIYPVECKEKIIYFQTEEVEYPIDFSLMIKGIADYLESSNSIDSFEANKFLMSVNFHRQVICGLKVYEFLYDYLEQVFEGRRELKVRDFYTYSDHKKAMMDRCRVLYEHGILQSKEFLHQATINHQMAVTSWKLALKYIIRKETKKNLGNELDSIKTILNTIEKNEKLYLPKMIAALEKHIKYQK